MTVEPPVAELVAFDPLSVMVGLLVEELAACDPTSEIVDPPDAELAEELVTMIVEPSAAELLPTDGSAAPTTLFTPT